MNDTLIYGIFKKQTVNVSDNAIKSQHCHTIQFLKTYNYFKRTIKERNGTTYDQENVIHFHWFSTASQGDNPSDGALNALSGYLLISLVELSRTFSPLYSTKARMKQVVVEAQQTQ